MKTRQLIASILFVTLPLACTTSSDRSGADSRRGSENAPAAGEATAPTAPASSPGGGAHIETPPEQLSPPDVAAPPSTAEREASGLFSRVLERGRGTARPSAGDVVKVHYTGWTTDGKMFDSSVSRGEPLTFSLDQVIAGWREGVRLMVEGEKRRLWIPEELAYKGQPNRPAGMLVFDVELIDIMNMTAPSDVAAPPSDASLTPSGLASKVLEAGSGTRKPGRSSFVTVHYTGWTTDGAMFDSSVKRGAPSTFPLSGVIAGWTEGLQLMVEGEKRRFWIPEGLAYKGMAGRPKGMLVFDVELISVND